MSRDNIKADEVFYYSKRGNQLTNNNKILMIVHCIFSAGLLIMFLLQLTTGNKAKVALYGTIFLSLSLIVSIPTYMRNKSSEFYHKVVLVSFMTAYTVIVFTAQLSSVIVYIYPVMTCCMIYDDVKFIRSSAAFIIIISLVKIVVIISGNAYGSSNISEAFVQTVTLIIYLVCLMSFNKAFKRYTEDSQGKLVEDSEKQKRLLSAVVDISNKVQTELGDIDTIMSELESSSETVNRSLKEIGDSTLSTAESIQTQTSMTKSIQDIITETKGLSDNIVDVTKVSSESVNEGIHAISNMKDQSVIIGDTNEQVAAAMERLQSKSKEVSDIAQMIFKISNQTNLLALNASIESARAGEAGKGFAVVATQIQQLAEKTRISTENITLIIDELNANADDVAEKIKESVDATGKQQEYLNSAANHFDSLGENINALAGHIHELDDKLNNLLSSNSTIVENISQISATSEEVTASAEVAIDYSNENLSRLSNTKRHLDEVVETTKSVDNIIN